MRAQVVDIQHFFLIVDLLDEKHFGTDHIAKIHKIVKKCYEIYTNVTEGCQITAGLPPVRHLAKSLQRIPLRVRPSKLSTSRSAIARASGSRRSLASVSKGQVRAHQEGVERCGVVARHSS